jgi:hemolysin activation/secretion protein
MLGSLEWHSLDLSNSLSGWAGDEPGKPGQAFVSRAFALAFADAGRAYIFDPAVGQSPYTSLASVGVGLRAWLGKSVTGAFDLAWPLKATSATSTGSPRALVTVALGF